MNSVCMCMYVFMYVCMYVCLFVCMNVYMYRSTLVWIYVCICRMYSVCVCVCVYVYVCMNEYMYVCIFFFLLNILSLVIDNTARRLHFFPKSPQRNTEKVIQWPKARQCWRPRFSMSPTSLLSNNLPSGYCSSSHG